MLDIQHGHSEHILTPNLGLRHLHQARIDYSNELLNYSAMALSRSGHSYTNIHNSDASRNHLGDVYNQYGSSPDQKAFQAVLDSLRYDGMDDRMDRLSSAERGTFEWALTERDEDEEEGEGDDDSEEYSGHSWRSTIDQSFTAWLAADDEESNMFCFMGKPGSGKSTLMYVSCKDKPSAVSCTDLVKSYRKYLSTNPKVEQFLEKWTAGKNLVCAEHFFWIMGGTVQKSREGLLRHLLYSALLSLPADKLDLAQRVCGPKRLSTQHQRSWSYEELYDMLGRLVSYSETKFFFLVDALDECDPQDSHGQLADEMIKISQLPNVKLCVSCRPWQPFVSKFRHDRTLYLEKMTYQDMECYIRNRLANADDENDLCSEFRSTGRTKRATQFAACLAFDAEGVFLWTELIVKALTSELRKECGFEQLQKVRSDFPIGLDEYFEKYVFDRISRTRKNTSDTAAALMLALKIAQCDENGDGDILAYPRSFINFWLLGTGGLTVGFSWTDFDETRDVCQDVERMVGLTTKFLQEACKDLLVVVERSSSIRYWEVEFLHRTVFDFLCDDRVRLVIEQQSPRHFENADFLTCLGRLRSVGLLGLNWKDCRYYQGIFTQTFTWSLNQQSSRQRDYAWLSRCETLMFNAHERMLKAGICRRTHHSLVWIHEYIIVGLSKYLQALIVLWPCLAVRQKLDSGPDLLEAFLSGWLTSMFDRPQTIMLDGVATCGLRSTMNPRCVVSSLSGEYTCLYERSTAYLRHPLAYMLSGRHVKLFRHLLSCGIDPNHQSYKCSHRGVPGDLCDQSLWQDWLRFVYLELEVEQLEHPAGLDIVLNHVRNSIKDVMAVFLQHGADPAC